MEKPKLDRERWLRAARRALLRGGPAAVRVEPLAAELKVTKGSFYWHFRDRSELLEMLLRDWEAETADLIALTNAHRDPRDGIRWLLEEVSRRVVLSERGEAPSDAAIFAWSAHDPAVARRVARVEEKRYAFFERLTGSAERGELVYLCYLGFIDRRRRVPGMARRFISVMESMLALASEAAPDRKTA